MYVPLRRFCWPLTARWLSDCGILSSTSVYGTSCWRADRRWVARAGARAGAPLPPRAHLPMSSSSSLLLSASSSCSAFVFTVAVEHWKLWRQNLNVRVLSIDIPVNNCSRFYSAEMLLQLEVRTIRARYILSVQKSSAADLQTQLRVLSLGAWTKLSARKFTARVKIQLVLTSRRL